MQDKKFPKIWLWAIYFALIFFLALGEAPCADGADGQAKVRPKRGDPIRKITTQIKEKSLAYVPDRTWPFMFWGETLLEPSELHLKEGVDYKDFQTFVDDYQLGLILEGKTFDELKSLTVLYNKFKKSVGTSSKMTAELLTEFIVSRNMADDPFNTVTFAHQLIDDFSNKLEAYIKNDNIKQHLTIIAVCTDIPDENVNNYRDTRDDPDEDDCLIPYDAVVLRYKIAGLKSEGLIILDPLRFGFRIVHYTQNIPACYLQYSYKERDCKPNHSILYYLKRPSFTEVTSSINLVHSFKKIVTYNRMGLELASVHVNIETNPTVKIYSASGKQVAFALNDLKFKEPTSGSDSNENGLVIALNDAAVDEDDICQVCGRKNKEFESDDEKCQAGHCLTKEIIEDVKKVLFPNSSGEVLIETLFHLRAIVNDSHFMVAFRINKRWLIKRIHDLIEAKQPKKEIPDKSTEAASEPVPVKSATEMAETEPVNDSQEEVTEVKKKVHEKTSQLINDITEAIQDEKKMTKLAAFLIVLFPVIMAIIDP